MKIRICLSIIVLSSLLYVIMSPDPAKAESCPARSNICCIDNGNAGYCQFKWMLPTGFPCRCSIFEAPGYIYGKIC